MVESDVQNVIDSMEELKDTQVPSNVQDLLDNAIEALEDEDEELSVRVNTATSYLDEISNDPNIAQHTRTEVWNIASMLESVEN
ncbi:MAG: UPF0147 family protein [Candidatus Nanohaloarchaea archaeon]|nr:UPF0147 family protein [Candidatus Nanohaloarchaea archaeon]